MRICRQSVDIKFQSVLNKLSKRHVFTFEARLEHYSRRPPIVTSQKMRLATTLATSETWRCANTLLYRLSTAPPPEYVYKVRGLWTLASLCPQRSCGQRRPVSTARGLCKRTQEEELYLICFIAHLFMIYCSFICFIT